jgi:hypothetical protein
VSYVRAGEPLGLLPGIVPLAVLAARGDTVAVALIDFRAYADGFGFDVVTMAAPEAPALRDPFGFHRTGLGDEAPGSLRFGFAFADGSAVMSTDHPRSQHGPTLYSGSGGGGPAQHRQRQWVQPLPPPGPLTFLCEWEARGILLTRTQLNAQAIRDAAARARQVLLHSRPPDLPESA